MKILIDEKTLDVCPRRRILEINRFRLHLLSGGHTIVGDLNSADRIYLFTCAYNKPMEELSLKTVKKYSVCYGDKLVVAGCLPQIYISKVRQIFSGRIVNNQMLRKFPVRFKPSKDIGVSWGCLGDCAYCVDKLAVGKLKSRNLEECLADFKAGLNSGYRSFRIVGDDLGAWGQDIGLNFIILLESFTSVKSPASDFSLHLMEINANWLVRFRKKMEVFDDPRFKDLLVGIQSASNRVLKIMRRNYKAEEVCEVIEILKGFDMRLGVHFIVGFPTETRKEFMDSLHFITSSEIDFGFLFLYSDMELTPAFNITPKVEEAEERMFEAGEVLKASGYRVSRIKRKKLKFTRL